MIDEIVTSDLAQFGTRELKPNFLRCQKKILRVFGLTAHLSNYAPLMQNKGLGFGSMLLFSKAGNKRGFRS